MERPVIKDKKILEYVESLETQLQNFKTESSYLTLYVALKKQSDSLSKSYFDAQISVMSLKDKDDKIFDRYMKWVAMAPTVTKALDELEKKINPEKIKKVDKFLKGYGASVEELIGM